MPEGTSWRAELSNELRTQHNAYTEHPLFCVQQERIVWGMAEGYSDDYKWYDPDNVETCDEEDALKEVRARESVKIAEYEEIDLEDYGYRKVFYVKYWDFVTAHFTGRAADRYIRENAHNLNNPRVYVTSQSRCGEWNRVRTFLLQEKP